MCYFLNIKKTILIILILAMPLVFFAQVIKSPTYSKRDKTSIEITEIEQTIDYTIVRGIYTNPYDQLGWANIEGTASLIDKRTGTKYKIIKSEGLPISPNKKEFGSKGETVNYTFYFPRISDSVELVDLIESPNLSGFNFYDIALKDNVVRKFTLTHKKGNSFAYKPSLASRLNGVKEVQVFIPSYLTDLDKYIFGNFIGYLNELGLGTDVAEVTYENKLIELTTMAGFFRVCKRFEDAFEHLASKGSNVLLAVLNYSHVGGSMTETTASITFVDPINRYEWKITEIDIPNKGIKLKKRFKDYITGYYNYNPNYSYIPSSISSNWNERIFKDDILKNGADALEGIYKGDKYTLGVKKADDGIYYMIYLDGADNPDDWHEGDIKAVLKSTASPILFKADWFGQWKQKIEQTVSFTNVGLVVQNNEIEPETYIKMFPDATMYAEFAARNAKSSGTGFFLTKDGYVVTNNHVIENAKSIKITGINNDYQTSYKAKVEITDTQNDLAILKIIDSNFKSLANIPYTFKFNTSSVGEDCFVLGYPLISTMGTDIKLTTGIISSKTGYEGSVAEYQISAPVQPGNSGAPLFDKSGNIIGVIKAKHTIAENAGYAVKASYVRNLVELLPVSIELPKSNVLLNKTLPKQVELASKSVCLIIVNGD